MTSHSSQSFFTLDSHQRGIESIVSNDFVEAEKHLNNALIDNESSSAVLSDLGIAVFRQGRREEALKCFKKAVDIDSNYARGWSNFGSALIECGLINDALTVCYTAVRLQPNLYEAQKNLASALSLSGSHKEAARHMLLAADIKPYKAERWLEAGDSCREAGMMSRAVSCYRTVLSLEPSNKALSVYQSELLLGIGEHCKAEKLIYKMLNDPPDDPSLHSALLMSLQYLPTVQQSQMFAEASRWGGHHGIRIPKPAPDRLNSDKKLRIGYVSADFYRHPVGVFLLPLLRYRNRDSFSVVCYSNSLREDAVTAEIRSLVDEWRVIAGQKDRDVIDSIQEDQIDILVDLSGHTAGNRLPLFAGRAAPVQASFLGYSHTTGLKAMDYLLYDNYSVDPDDEQWFTEKVIRLPRGRFCYIAPDFVPDVDPLPTVENGCITFGCFNNPAKINAAVIALWSQILLKITNSRLVLKWKSFAYSEDRKRLLSMFTDHGVASSRIEFRDSSPHFLMMSEYSDIDIALDPFPFTGGITTCEALWMGVPVITLPGETPISRQTASFLTQIGLGEFVAASLDDYVSIAQRMSVDMDRLITLRSGLRARMLASSLCHGEEYTADVESAYLMMFEEKCSEYSDTTVSEEDIALGFETAGLLFTNKQYDRAEDLYLDILKWRPDNSRALHAVGVIAEKRGDVETAIGFLKQAIEFDHDREDAYLNLGNILRRESRLAEAEQCYRDLIKIKQNSSYGLANLGGALWAQGRVEEASCFFQQAYSVDSTNITAASGMLFMMNYLPNCTPEDVCAAHAKWGRAFERSVKNYSQWANTRDQDRVIRIGYVSGDFGIHPVGFFMVNPIGTHARNKCQVICYSNRSEDDVITSYIKEQSDAWREICDRTDDEVCKLIRKDHIDILVDLSGHTGRSRLKVFARQPAPIQVSWLGYPNTTGLKRIQYRFTDAITDPPGRADTLHTERLIRLPSGFLNFYPSTEAPDIEPLPYIKNGYITFGSFNNVAKITPEVVAVWSRVMRAAPGSRFLMKYSSLHDASTVQRYIRMFNENGIESDRIELVPSTVTHTEHLNIYNRVDIALDPFPYNGTTTTCEALWMGVPVIVMKGEQHSGRVGMSILHRLSLDEYVANDEDEYVGKAMSISSNIEKLAWLRSVLRDRMAVSPLCNSSGFSLSLENAYREMWKIWCQGAGNDKKQRTVSRQIRNTIRRLHIGGTIRKKGWENFNALSDSSVDHLGDAADLSRFEDNTFMEIYASHVLEHFEYQLQLKMVLAEWFRVLALGGTLYISVPNLDIFAEMWNEHGTTDGERFFIMQMIFGGHVDAFDYHFSGFNEAILSKYLKECGFVEIQRVSRFGIFNDTSNMKFKGMPVSLNITARKPEIEADFI